ncbi:MAG: tRNA 2-thiouridine(34) synthase MnmA [Minisyncoccia bacterium]|jgi:tRNA-specific 2-thiouridylase
MSSFLKKLVFVGMSPLRPARRDFAGQAGGGKKSKLVFVGMSGGVDSSVAAYLLKKQGYDVVGVFMRCYNLDGCSERDAEDARRVAEHIGIPFYVWDFEDEYKKRVVKYMVDGYRAGITPNPDVICNREIKFGLFFEKALSMGADYVATGHYVRKFAIRNSQLKNSSITNCGLRIAKDLNKDQSYFLWMLTAQRLRHCLFPIGDYLKPKVRDIARKAKLPTADKKDSQGICFLGMIDIFEFLKKYIPEHRGALVTTAGEAVGEHFGTEFYTIGERHINADFKFPKAGAAARKPFYVASKNSKTNTVILAEGGENPALYKKEIKLTDVHFINPLWANSRELAHKGASVFARVRYRQPLAKAVLSGGAHGRAKLVFAKPQKFVASGQSAVFYDKNGVMLGGGVIL